MNFEYELKIPEERVGVLVGVKGNVKRKIERKLSVRINVSSEGDVVLSGEDGVKLYIAQQIAKAIGRGFNPDIALRLVKENYIMEMLDITEYSGKSKKKLFRLRSRVIGRNGRARELIEEFTGASVVIFGKTITIIGEYSSVALARKAFEGLLSGLRHATIFTMLEKENRNRKVGFYE